MYTVKKTLPVLLLAITTLLCMQAVRAQQPAKGVKNIVLVHGAFADGSSWVKIIPALRAKGYQVIAVQNPLSSIADDVAATKRAIALLEGPVLLVGHSYGGMVVTEAGNDPKVAGLLYVCALIPDDNQNVQEVTKAFPPAPGNAEIREHEGFLTLTSKGIHTNFAQDLSPASRELLYVTQGPWAVKATMDRITQAAWKTKPAWCIIGTDDQMVPAPLARAEAKMIKAKTLELKASHVPMLSMPDKVVAFITGAAQSL